MNLPWCRIGLLLLALAHLQHIQAQLRDCSVKADVCFVVDSSGSIRDNNPRDGSYDNWSILLNFLVDLTRAFDIGRERTRVGLIKFSNQGNLIFNLEAHQTRAELERAILATSFSGGRTNTNAGINFMRRQCFGTSGDRPDVPNIAFVVTDGVPTIDETDTIPSAQAAMREGVQMFAIGITRLVNEDFLREISSSPQEQNRNWFSTPNFQALSGVIDSVVEETCDVIQPSRPTVNPDDCPDVADIAFVVDSSSSITYRDAQNWNRLRNFINTVISYFPVSPGETHVGMVKFSTRASVEFYMDEHQSSQAVEDAVNRIRHTGGETNIAEALQVTEQQLLVERRGDRPDVVDIIIVITDGNANINANLVGRRAQELRDRGHVVMAIGITDDVDQDELNSIASDRPNRPGEKLVYTVEDFTRLQGIIDDVIQQACVFIPTVIAPPPPTSTSTTTTTTPRPLPPVEGCQGGLADVIFVLDASGSIGDRNFDRIRNFLANVVNQLDIDGNRIRIGVETFSDRPDDQFHLNTYTNRAEMANAISNIPYTRGTTNTASALQFARESMLTQFRGRRNGARGIVIILTDGESNDGVQTLREAKLTRDDNIHIMSVGIGNWIDRYELEAMASFPYTENFIHVDSFNALNTIVTTLRDAICDNVDECRRNPCRNGRCNNGIQHYWCECFEGWAGRNCDQRCENGGDIIFAVDSSGSIGQENFRTMISFLTDVVERLDIDNSQSFTRGNRVGMVTFANDYQLQFNLNEYRNKVDLLDAINVRYSGGTTNTASAIRYVRENMVRTGQRSNVPKYLVILTDGKSDDRAATWQEAMLARQQGIHIMAVGIGGGVGLEELRGMASYPFDSNVMTVDNFESLQNIVTTLTTGLCNNEDECASNPCRNRATCTDLVFGYTCSPCPFGFTGFNCERPCSGVNDVVFVLDKSGSIRKERFPKVLDFVASLIMNMDVGPDRTRIGIASWSDSAAAEVRLNQYDTREDVVQAVMRLEFAGGRTNTASSLELLRTQMFQPNMGDRDNAPNFAIYLTDGNSNINPEDTIPEAIATRVDGVHIIVASVGRDLNRLELESMASEPKQDNMYSVQSIRDLPQIQEELISSICDDVDECRNNPCRNGRCINGLKRYMCDCNSGFTGYNCDRRCSRQLDISLILDLSGSVEEEYRMTIDFAREIVYGVDMSFDRTRIAAIAYSTNIIDQFYMNTYQQKESVINALNFYHKGGRTNTQEALRVMNSEIFASNRGDRSGVRNVAIVVSDGYANVFEENTVREAQRAKDRGAFIYTVAIGGGPNLREMNEIASDPDSEYAFRLPSINDVERVASEVLDNLCQ